MTASGKVATTGAATVAAAAAVALQHGLMATAAWVALQAKVRLWRFLADTPGSPGMLNRHVNCKGDRHKIKFAEHGLTRLCAELGASLLCEMISILPSLQEFPKE